MMALLDSLGEVTVGLSDLLLCLEMAIVSVVHAWIFSPKEHQHGFFELIDENDVSRRQIREAKRGKGWRAVGRVLKGWM